MGIKKLETSKRLTLMKRTEIVINCLHPKKKKKKRKTLQDKTKKKVCTSKMSTYASKRFGVEGHL